ncbi:Tol-Pal system beta propeller repeat protein TolB [Permianibacter aggregans]|uniref:Tol-Pal system protein TolB n=1 Tax=Permianibacter aggregans TaxID=1510150 RepID=A0A4R6UMK1_9GAMM|nr:Tol-Pal system beta propeller repeat protein TolB [Permianibacter aggregans]QGX41087.1 Tol-Pal system protein TolB [Permianibacter aggregans]TDQ48151.1 TolB protein [Permianibacter aggregans]
MKYLWQRFLLICGVMSWLSVAHADLEIVITEGLDDARPVAVVPFAWQGSTAEPPQDIGNIIARDLERSGRFRPLSLMNLPERPTRAGDVNLSKWRTLGIEAVVVGRITETAPGQYQVGFELVDVFKGKGQGAGNLTLSGGELISGAGNVIEARQHLVQNAGLRMHAHRIADIVYEKLTGVRGAFATYIAYVNVDHSDSRYPFKLYMADSDDYNPRLMAQSREPIMSPAWSRDSKKLAYVSFEGGRSQIVVQELATGNRQTVASFAGINGAPSWSPDGTKMAMTLSYEGNAEVYIYDLATRTTKRITVSSAAETDPMFAPDGKHLYYTSDRGGRPQIYRTHLASGQVERVTFEGTYNSEPRFNGDPNKMVFVNQTDGQYRVSIMDLRTKTMQILTDTQLDQSPTLAPNGSMVIYATIYQGRQMLAAVSTDGRFKARLQARKGEVRAPAWSPFLDF